MKKICSFCLAFLLPWMAIVAPGQTPGARTLPCIYPFSARVYDSLLALSIPEAEIPAGRLKSSLPAVIDNSENQFWPGLQDQYAFYSCQQYSGVVYTFGYESSRLRNRPGWFETNRFPAHFTWNFMNEGGRYNGVSFLQSFEAIRQQGHSNFSDFGTDTAGSYLGWMSGYDKYYNGMGNRLKRVRSIRTDSETGINTLRQYLCDHLDGSEVGGIACFTTDSYFYDMVYLPPGTPEEGKYLMVHWHSRPDHGLTIVGYNDSIRYDINNDDQYTNTVDLNGDGVVNPQDWEIGGFKFANSWGYWWGDTGFAYVSYSAMAKPFEGGGIWNNRVYIVEADTGYRPLLTVKVNLEYNKRKRLRVLAGVSRDTISQMPEQVMSFPYFNFQGGDFPMKGNEDDSEPEVLEFGLDITQLLDFMPEGENVRIFLGVEERDPDHSGNGLIRQVSFISYSTGIEEFAVAQENTIIRDNEVTFVSKVLTAPPLNRVEILTQTLPPFHTGQPYAFQLQSAGGTPPCTWSLDERYSRQTFKAGIPAVAGPALVMESNYQPFAAVALPFPFPFYGQMMDSIYINYYGFIAFERQSLIPPYITDEITMLKLFPVISPAFSQQYTYLSSKNDGIWFAGDTEHAVIRWKTSVAGHENNSENNFALVLYPDGRFEFRYGSMNDTPVLTSIYTGISKGDVKNYEVQPQWDRGEFAGTAVRYLPFPVPGSVSLSPGGLLTIPVPDPELICSIPVKVTDEENLSDTKSLTLAGDLYLQEQLVCSGGENLIFGESASLNLVIKNNGTTALLNLPILLRSSDTSCLVTDSLLIIPVINPGQTLSRDRVFSFTPAHMLPAGYTVRFSLHTGEGQRRWNKIFGATVAAPSIGFISPVIEDGDNQMPDPGEVTDLVITAGNSGNLEASDVEIRLESTDSLVQILSPAMQIVDPFEPLTRIEKRFTLQVSRNTRLGHIIPMRVTATAQGILLASLDFSLASGRTPVAIVNLCNSVASRNAMSQALDSLTILYDTLRNTGSRLDQYSSVFVILGNATSGSHVLNHSEAAILEQYLLNNGNLYMEGYFTWYYSGHTVLHPYFKYTSNSCPQYYFNNPTGIPSTFADSMSFGYNGTLNYCYFNISPQPPAFGTFTNSGNTPRALEIAYDGADYRTIGTFLEFASMTGGEEPSTRRTLMKRYLEFFGLNITGPHPFFHAGKTSICKEEEIVFTDDSFDNIQSWQWSFPGGSPSVSGERNPVVRYDSAGVFQVELTVWDGIHSKTLVREDYITVRFCPPNPGIEPAPEMVFSLFPNPARDRVTVCFSRHPGNQCIFTLYDITGRRVAREEWTPGADERSFEWKLPLLNKGIYLVRTEGGRFLTGTRKLILE